MSFEDKVVLITGGTTGIGLACARHLRRAGAKVAVCGFQEPEFSTEEVDLALFGDLVDEDFCHDVVSTVLNHFDRIDILVNCAGVGLYAPASDSDLHDVQRIFDVNLFAMLRMVQLVRPHMQAAGRGTIVNIGSVGGCVTLPWSTMYCVSKYAVHGLTEGLYRELRREGIHVMLVVPGIVQTRFREHVIAGRVPPGVGRIRRIIPAERLAASIVRGIEHRRRKVTNPWLASCFELVNRLFPSVMDWYCALKWRPERTAALPSTRRKRAA
jgi:dehydrogenase/reductase SDR family protein 7B